MRIPHAVSSTLVPQMVSIKPSRIIDSQGYDIPFNRPSLVGPELEYIADAVRRGHASGDGYYSKRCRELLERELDVDSVLLTTSCTHALEMMALLLDIKPGDEIILPSFTFVSTANAFVLRGARPVFVDVRADTLNIDEAQLGSSIASNKSDRRGALRRCGL